jgi:hypothetical protein
MGCFRQNFHATYVFYNTNSHKELITNFFVLNCQWKTTLSRQYFYLDLKCPELLS